jgi:sterol desaturase/sphingolipid hydroxylase (fatty acid hydroxylase superfamily)
MDAVGAILPSLRGIAVLVARLGVWLLILGVVFIPLERLFSLRPAKLLRAGLLVDVGYYILNGVLPGLVLSLPLAAVAWLGRYTFVAAAFDHAPIAVRAGVALVVAEVGFYWGHRWSHEIPLLWRFHAVHHSPTHVDWLVNARGHPVDFIFTRLCGFVPVYALGLANPMSGRGGWLIVLVMLIGSIWGYFIHANVRWRFGPLEWLIATPAFHHWHHANDGPGVLDKNYAPMFPWVDRIFGSLHLPGDRQPAVYGTDSAVAADMAGQLIGPFARSRPTMALPSKPI